jgi:hypothetical protein
MDKFVAMRFEGKADQFFSISYQIIGSDHKVIDGGKSSLPNCPKLINSVRRWRAAYHADVRSRRLGKKDGYINNSSEIDHHKLTDDLRTDLNHWLSSLEFQSFKEKLFAKLSPKEVVLVGIETDDVDLKYVPWHLWSFFDTFSKSDYTLLRPNFSRLDDDFRNKKKEFRSHLNIMAIIGDSTGINTREDTTIIKSLPGVHNLQILSEPSRDKVVDVLWDSQDTDILFFAGHGKKDQDRGRICINGKETLGVEEMRSGLQKRIQEGLQLAIFNSCDGLELGEELADLSIPQAIVMKEAVPDDIAQRFLKDFLTEFSQGVPLVQALRQTRNKLKDKEYAYPYASWLPVLYCNPTEPLMQWSCPQPPFLQRYPWQTKLAASCLVSLVSIAGIGFLPQVSYWGKSMPPSPGVSLNKPYKDPEFQLNYPQTWQAQEESDGVLGDMAKILLLENREVQLTINIRDLASEPLRTEDWQRQLLENLKKYSENFNMIQQKPTTLALRKGYEIVFTTTEKGKTYKKVIITALKNNKAYSAIYSAPEGLFTEHETVAREMIDSLNLTH